MKYLCQGLWRIQTVVIMVVGIQGVCVRRLWGDQVTLPWDEKMRTIHVTTIETVGNQNSCFGGGGGVESRQLCQSCRKFRPLHWIMCGIQTAMSEHVKSP